MDTEESSYSGDSDDYQITNITIDESVSTNSNNNEIKEDYNVNFYL